MTIQPKMKATTAVNLLYVQSLKMEVRGLEKALKQERARVEALQLANQKLQAQIAEYNQCLQSK